MNTFASEEREMTICDRDIVEHIPKQEIFDNRLLQLIQVASYYQTLLRVVSGDWHQMIRYYENSNQWLTLDICRIDYKENFFQISELMTNDFWYWPCIVLIPFLGFRMKSQSVRWPIDASTNQRSNRLILKEHLDRVKMSRKEKITQVLEQRYLARSKRSTKIAQKKSSRRAFAPKGVFLSISIWSN